MDLERLCRGRASLAASLLLIASAATAAEKAYTVDPAKSRVRIQLGRAGLLKMMGHDHTLEAPVAEGRLQADPADVGRSSVTLRFEAARLAVVPDTEPAKDVPEVEAKMRGPEVLDVARHPQIAFTSTSVAPAEPGSSPGPGGAHKVRLRGTLQIKGRSVAVEVSLEARLSPEGLVAKGEIPLLLRDLGIEPPSVAGVVKVANRFTLSFEIHARPDSP